MVVVAGYLFRFMLWAMAGWVFGSGVELAPRIPLAAGDAAAAFPDATG